MEVRSAQLYYAQRNAEVRWPEYWVAHIQIQVLHGPLFKFWLAHYSQRGV